MGILGLFATLFKPDNSEKIIKSLESVYELNFINLEGNSKNLSDFKDKYLLIVNTASKCGFTPQLEDLQKLHELYPEKLVIIGFPCNQFGEQEPGSAAEIGAFCQKNYGVDFLLSEKIEVKGENQHPIYQWLTQKEKNGKMTTSVKWNFQKYLIDKEGNLIDVFYSTTSPLSEKITKHIQ